MKQYRAGARRGTHATKNRALVSGSGKKPWREKGTGRARAGETRNPLWRHGGITFGPKPRSYVQAVPAAKRRLALRIVLSDLARQGRLSVVEDFAVAEPKTRRVASLAGALKLPPRTVVVVKRIDPVLARAARNLAGLRVITPEGLNSYGALQAERRHHREPPGAGQQRQRHRCLQVNHRAPRRRAPAAGVQQRRPSRRLRAAAEAPDLAPTLGRNTPERKPGPGIPDPTRRPRRLRHQLLPPAGPDDILDEEADELVLHIKSLIKKIRSSNLNVAFSGSLIDNKNFYSDLLKNKITSTLPNVKVVKPANPPVSGAILFAKRLADEK